MNVRMNGKGFRECLSFNVNFNVNFERILRSFEMLEEPRDLVHSADFSTRRMNQLFQDHYHSTSTIDQSWCFFCRQMVTWEHGYFCGLEHEVDFSIQLGIFMNFLIPADEIIFFRGVETTKHFEIFQLHPPSHRWDANGTGG